MIAMVYNAEAKTALILAIVALGKREFLDGGSSPRMGLRKDAESFKDEAVF